MRYGSLGVGFGIGCVVTIVILLYHAFWWWFAAVTQPFRFFILPLGLYAPVVIVGFFEGIIGGVWSIVDFVQGRYTFDKRRQTGSIIGFFLCTWMFWYLAYAKIFIEPTLSGYGRNGT